MYIGTVDRYRPRLVDDVLQRLLADHPAVSVTGPRACGKTTTARRCAKSLARLDRPTEAAAFEADPDVALRALDAPALIDEWQEVPGVLGALKRAVDDDPRPGRFLLTGSVRAELDVATWPGTGRLIRLPMWPLTVSEIDGGNAATLLDRWARSEFDVGTLPRLDLGDYVRLMARGGFPDPALRLSGRDGSARAAMTAPRLEWLDSYAEQIVTRDAVDLGGLRDPSRFRRYLEAVALNTAGMPTDTTLGQAVGADRRTIASYEALMVNLLLLDRVPSWSANRLSRLSKTPKRFVVDSGLAMSLMRVDEAGVLRDGDALGRLLETFVAAQLRPLLSLSPSRPRLYHLRQGGGDHEIDLLLEFGGGRVVGIEVKATSTPSLRDARHLLWLQEQIGDRFMVGVVLHTGLVKRTLATGIHAAPIAALWA